MVGGKWKFLGILQIVEAIDFYIANEDIIYLSFKKWKQREQVVLRYKLKFGNHPKFTIPSQRRSLQWDIKIMTNFHQPSLLTTEQTRLGAIILTWAPKVLGRRSWHPESWHTPHLHSSPPPPGSELSRLNRDSSSQSANLTGLAFRLWERKGDLLALKGLLTFPYSNLLPGARL